MIIVDTSVWIDYFNGTSTPEADHLDHILGQEHVGIGDLIMAETLQGFRSDEDFKAAQSALDSLTCFHLLGKKRAKSSAMKYRWLRQNGITIRKTADTIIASFCIDEGHSLLFSDRDFLPFTEHMGLKSAL